MNSDSDEDIGKKVISTCKGIGDQMAFLEFDTKNKLKNNDNSSGYDNIIKGKNKNPRGTRVSIYMNRTDTNKINNLKNRNSVIDSISNQQNTLNNLSNSNNNISANNIKKNPVNNKNIPSSVTYPSQSENIYRNNDLIKKPSEVKNFESMSNDIPEDLVEIEKISPEEFNDMSDDSINPFIFEKSIISKSRQHNIYQRSMINLKKKETKLKKKKEFFEKQKYQNVHKFPEINDKSNEIILSKGLYIPIENRAAKLHSQRLTQIILNEQINKIKKEEQEEKEMSQKIYKKYNPREWNEFVERCFEWKKDVLYKRKAEEIMKTNSNNRNYYKPRINENSKKIMRKLINKSNTSVDDVFTRLYNDYEEHKERQQDLENKNKPSFNPIVNNSKFSKNLYKKQFRNRSFDNNNSYEKFITDESKSNFFLESQITINDGKLKKKKKRALRFVNKGKNEKVENYRNTMEENNNYNKSYKPTQATNHTTLYMNTDINMNMNANNKIKFKKYLNTENNNNLTTETNLITNQNYLPTDINVLTDENKIIDEINENNNNSFSIKNNENKNFFENIGEYGDVNNQSNNQNYSDNSRRIKTKEENYEERILKELDEAKLINKERLEKNSNNEESKNDDNSLYKINIMETTPDNMKQNVVIPSNKYQDFFDIEEINEL